MAKTAVASPARIAGMQGPPPPIDLGAEFGVDVAVNSPVSV